VWGKTPAEPQQQECSPLGEAKCIRRKENLLKAITVKAKPAEGKGGKAGD